MLRAEARFLFGNIHNNQDRPESFRYKNNIQIITVNLSKCKHEMIKNYASKAIHKTMTYFKTMNILLIYYYFRRVFNLVTFYWHHGDIEALCKTFFLLIFISLMCKTKFNSICRYVLTIKILLIMYWRFFNYKRIYFGHKSLGKPISGATAEVTILSSIYFIFIITVFLKSMLS